MPTVSFPYVLIHIAMHSFCTNPMEDMDILEKLRVLNSESQALLVALHQLNNSFDNCAELVKCMGCISSRIKKAMLLYRDILDSSVDACT